MMNNNYETLRDRIVTAITAHLLNVEELRPSAEVPTLGRQIADVVFSELTAAGLTKEKLQSLSTANFAAATARTA